MEHPGGDGGDKLKRHFLSTLTVIALLLSLTGCGRGTNNVDVGKWAILKLPNDSIVEGEIESLTRWSTSYVEVVIDGIEYRIHPTDFSCYEKEA